MNLSKIEVSRAEALNLFKQYQAVLKDRLTKHEREVMLAYKLIAKGKVLIDLVKVMTVAGLDHRFYPRLATVRADAEYVYYRAGADGGCSFSMDQYFSSYASRRYIGLPANTFPRPPSVEWIWENKLAAKVPFIPSYLRPESSLSNFHILWEADWTQLPPKDPILLKRVSGLLFVVVAGWDLTEVEQAILR